MLDIWKKESSTGSVEVCEYLKRTALDIVVEAILGYNLNSLGDPSNPATNAARVMLGMFPKTLVPFYKFIHPLEYQELKRSRDYLRRLIEKMLDNFK